MLTVRKRESQLRDDKPILVRLVGETEWSNRYETIQDAIDNNYELRKRAYSIYCIRNVLDPTKPNKSFVNFQFKYVDDDRSNLSLLMEATGHDDIEATQIKTSKRKVDNVDIKEINKEFICPICLDTLRFTLINPSCLHRFCKECIEKHLRLGKSDCPMCRISISTHRSLREDPDTDNKILETYLNSQNNCHNPKQKSQKTGSHLDSGGPDLIYITVCKHPHDPYLSHLKNYYLRLEHSTNIETLISYLKNDIKIFKDLELSILRNEKNIVLSLQKNINDILVDYNLSNGGLVLLLRVTHT